MSLTTLSHMNNSDFTGWQDNGVVVSKPKVVKKPDVSDIHAGDIHNTLTTIKKPKKKKK